MSNVKFVVIIAVLAAAVGSALFFYPWADADFRFAERTNTVAAYRSFLASHPKDRRREVVLARIDQLSWDAANQPASVASVGAYIHEFPNGKHVNEARELRNNLEMASWSVFEGTTMAVADMGGGLNSKGALTLDAPAIILDTRGGHGGRYQILTSSKTVYQGIKVTPEGVEWHLGKRVKVRGKLVDTPKGPHLGGVEFIDARVIEAMEK